MEGWRTGGRQGALGGQETVVDFVCVRCVCVCARASVCLIMYVKYAYINHVATL